MGETGAFRYPDKVEPASKVYQIDCPKNLHASVKYESITMYLSITSSIYALSLALKTNHLMILPLLMIEISPQGMVKSKSESSLCMLWDY